MLYEVITGYVRGGIDGHAALIIANELDGNRIVGFYADVRIVFFTLGENLDVVV